MTKPNWHGLFFDKLTNGQAVMITVGTV